MSCDEAGIIVAGIGSATGTIDAELFAVIVAMSVLTTLFVPPVLRRLAAPRTPPPDRLRGGRARGSRPSGA